MSATPKEIDFTSVTEDDPNGVEEKRYSTEGKVLTPKQIRARMRRKQARRESITDEELEALYQKPIEDWDMEELAMGRPKNKKGHFSGGPRPKWITMDMHERSMDLYRKAVKTSMQHTTVSALETLTNLLADESQDERGKPIVPASTKVDISKFLIEHVVGKPVARIENDVSVKLQGILGTVMVNPAELATGNYMPAHFPGMTMELSSATSGSDDDNDLLPSEG